MFPVEISDDNKDISDLKKLIKSEIDFPLKASDLDLWDADFSFEDERLANFVPHGQPLYPHRTLQMFKDGPKDHIHVIVEVPTGSMSHNLFFFVNIL